MIKEWEKFYLLVEIFIKEIPLLHKEKNISKECENFVTISIKASY